MYHQDLNEDTVLQANESFIKAMCDKYGKGLLWDDCFIVACEGFLYAMRTYNKAYHRFHLYSEACIKYYLEQEKRYYNRLRIIESRLSLDQQISANDGEKTIGDIFFASSDDTSECVLFMDSLQRLPAEKQMVAVMFAQGYTAQEIVSKLHIPNRRLQRIIEDLRDYYSSYYELAS